MKEEEINYHQPEYSPKEEIKRSPPTRAEPERVERRRKPIRRRREKEAPEKKESFQSTKPDYSTMTAEQKARARADFNIKFGLLRSAIGDKYAIPEFDEDEDLDVIWATYDRYLKQIYIDRSSDEYKIYLLVFFVGFELFGTKVLGLDFSGYALNQLTCMARYEKLLLELGEQSYSSLGANWPVPIRILLLALFNAVVFILFKYLTSYFGEEAANTIKSYASSFLSGKSTPEMPVPKGDAGVAAPPQADNGGFNLGQLGGLLGGLGGGLGGLFGGNNGQANAAGNNAGARPRASRRPTYQE
jgi:hypothetical protein